MAQNWDSHCNTKAYGADNAYVDNRESIEFKSGRKIFYKKNSLAKKTHALKFCFNDSTEVDGKTEFEWFLFWYEVTLKSGTESFYFTDIITHAGTKEYKIKESPTWSGLKEKEISLSFEEI
ncbi:MAG: hypothetical protein HUK20_01665 [Fibrobacter sp.]|nr:hypothetical protein [Fibrobacter sp.]